MPKCEVFISSKSQDYKLAKGIYDFLKSKGIYSFLASESLRKRGNAEYLNEIYLALDSCRHLIVFTTSKENVGSKFVQEEWQIFLNEKLNGRKTGNLLTIVGDGLNKDDLPIALRSREVISFKSYESVIMNYLSESGIKEDSNLIKHPQISIADHNYVDLGLPSRLLWATCNVGADRPESYGDYFSWSEICSKQSYEWSNLRFCNNKIGDSFSKYNTDQKGTKDGKKQLELSDDAANFNWGGAWRIPTMNEWVELRSSCEWEWVERFGISGYQVTGKGGKNIFLPAAGYRNGEGIYRIGEGGDYWSSSLRPDYSFHAFYCWFDSCSVDPSLYIYRYFGHSIRPVVSF